MKKTATILKLRGAAFPIYKCVLVRGNKARIGNLTTTLEVDVEYTGAPKVTSPVEFDLLGAEKCKDGYQFQKAYDFPSEIGFSIRHSLIMNEENIKDLIIAAEFTSDNDLRPAMEGVFVGKDIVATDAHILYVSPFIKKNPTEIIIRTEVVALLKMLKATGVMIYLDKLKRFAKITGNGFTITTRLIDGNYPKYKLVIPTKFNSRILVNRRELILALKQSLPFSSNPSLCTITPTLKPRIIHIYTKNLDINMSLVREVEILSKGRKKIEPFGLNINLILKCLNAVKDNQVQINIIDPNRAFMIGSKVLCMPVNIMD